MWYEAQHRPLAWQWSSISVIVYPDIGLWHWTADAFAFLFTQLKLVPIDWAMKEGMKASSIYWRSRWFESSFESWCRAVHAGVLSRDECTVVNLFGCVLDGECYVADFRSSCCAAAKIPQAVVPTGSLHRVNSANDWPMLGMYRSAHLPESMKTEKIRQENTRPRYNTIKTPCHCSQRAQLVQ